MIVACKTPTTYTFIWYALCHRHIYSATRLCI